MNLLDVIRLAGHKTVAQMLQRDSFKGSAWAKGWTSACTSCSIRCCRDGTAL